MQPIPALKIRQFGGKSGQWKIAQLRPLVSRSFGAVLLAFLGGGNSSPWCIPKRPQTPENHTKSDQIRANPTKMKLLGEKDAHEKSQKSPFRFGGGLPPKTGQNKVKLPLSNLTRLDLF
jgi:hypothetical protein